MYSVKKVYKLLMTSCLMFEIDNRNQIVYYDRLNHITLEKKTNNNKFVYY